MKLTYAQIEQEGRDAVTGICRLVERLSGMDEGKAVSTMESYIERMQDELESLKYRLELQKTNNAF